MSVTIWFYEIERVLKWQVTSVAIGHQEVNVHLYQESFLHERRSVGRLPNAIGRRVAKFAVVADSSQFIVQERMTKLLG